MNTFITFAEAQQQGGIGAMLIPMALVFGIFYFMMIRPQQRKEKERQRMIAELRAGQRVVFAGGLTGTIAEAREKTFMVEIAPKVVIEVARGSVSQVLQEDNEIEDEQH
ncbi:MAG: preprotein translocase subunit YajC [Kiritimatiellia bacterium]